MRYYLVFIPVVILYMAVKSTLLVNVPLPDVTLLAVFFVAWARPSVQSVVLAFILGYLDDVLSGGVIGTSSFTLVVVFLTMHFLSRKVHFSTPGMRAAGAGGLALIKGLLAYSVLAFAEMNIAALLDILLVAILTGVFAPAVLAVFDRLTSFVTPRTFEG